MAAKVAVAAWRVNGVSERGRARAAGRGGVRGSAGEVRAGLGPGEAGVSAGEVRARGTRGGVRGEVRARPGPGGGAGEVRARPGPWGASAGGVKTVARKRKVQTRPWPDSVLPSDRPPTFAAR